MNSLGSVGRSSDVSSSTRKDADKATMQETKTGGLALWISVRDEIKTRVGTDAFNKWIAGVEFVAEVDGEIILAAHSAVDCERINRDYLRKMDSIWKSLDARGRNLKVVRLDELDADLQELALANNRSASVDDLTGESDREMLIGRSSEDSEEPVAADVIDDDTELTGDDGYAQTFDTLIVGESNKVAASIAQKLASDIAGPVSVILFYGGHGVGKTHIMRAIQNEKTQLSGKASVVYMSAEEFMLTFMEGVKNKDTSSQRKRIRNANLVLLDDLQLILSRKGTLNEFFMHLRFVTDHGGKVVLSADAAPTRLESLDSRMRDEIKGGVIAEIHRPDREERASIVRSKVEIISRDFPNFHLKEEWIDMIADRLPASGRALYGAVRNVFAGTVLIDEPVTEAAVETAIRLQVGERRAPKLETVKDTVAKHYGLTKADLESAGRRQTLVRPRQIAMYLCRELTTCSFPQIGWSFGKRDHTTVMYGYRKVLKMLKKDPAFAEEVAEVERMVMESPRNNGMI